MTLGDALSRINARLEGYAPSHILTDDEIRSLIPLLEKYNGEKIRKLTRAREILADTRYISLTATQIQDKILADLVDSVDSSDYGTKVNTVVSKYDPDVLGALVDQVYQAVVGRFANKGEKKLRVAELQKYIDAGTRTTITSYEGGSKTVSEPGFSKELATTKIEAAIKKEAPEDLESMNQIRFHDFIIKNMGA